MKAEHVETYRQLFDRLEVDRASIYSSELIAGSYHRVEIRWQLLVTNVIMVATYNVAERLMRLDTITLEASGYRLTLPRDGQWFTDEFIRSLKERVHMVVTGTALLIDKGLKLEDLMAYVIEQEMGWWNG